jgi:hypothetical protein
MIHLLFSTQSVRTIGFVSSYGNRRVIHQYNFITNKWYESHIPSLNVSARYRGTLVQYGDTLHMLHGITSELESVHETLSLSAPPHSPAPGTPEPSSSTTTFSFSPTRPSSWMSSMSSSVPLTPPTTFWNVASPSPLSKQRFSSAAAVIVNNDSSAHGGHGIYLCGGTGVNGHMKQMQRYSLRSKQWTSLPSMHQQRSELAAVLLKDGILAMGGVSTPEPEPEPSPTAAAGASTVVPSATDDGTAPPPAYVPPRSVPRPHCVDTCEYYNFVRREWRLLPLRLPSPLCDFQAEICDSLLFIIGGATDTTVASAVANVWCIPVENILDDIPPSWIECPELPSPLYASASVVV